MPFFVPVFGVRPPAKRKRPAAPRRSAKPAADGCAPPDPVPAYAVTLLLDRLHAAIEAGKIELVGDATDTDPPAMDWGCLRELVAALFPEECVHARPLAAAPDGSPPGSAARVAEYRRRFGRGELVFHPRDADPRRNGRVVAGHRRGNGHGGPAVEGWG